MWSNNDEEKRGAIINQDGYLQSKLISYEGLDLIRNITPTDIDATYDSEGNIMNFAGVTEYKGNLVIYYEGKRIGQTMKYGQSTFFKNQINNLSDLNHCRDKLHGKGSCTNVRKYGVLIVFGYDEPHDQTIFAKDKYVIETYDSETQRWLELKKEITILNYLKNIIKFCRENNMEI